MGNPNIYNHNISENNSRPPDDKLAEEAATNTAFPYGTYNHSANHQKNFHCFNLIEN